MQEALGLVTRDAAPAEDRHARDVAIVAGRLGPPGDPVQGREREDHGCQRQLDAILVHAQESPPVSSPRYARCRLCTAAQPNIMSTNAVSFALVLVWNKILSYCYNLANWNLAFNPLLHMNGPPKFVDAGGLISYGPNIANGYQQAGIYAGQILRGRKSRYACHLPRSDAA